MLNGESGSGKSETAKALLRHLLQADAPIAAASAGAASAEQPQRQMQGSALKDRIVHVNVLLEALGNARLCRNLNSR